MFAGSANVLEIKRVAYQQDVHLACGLHDVVAPRSHRQGSLGRENMMSDISERPSYQRRRLRSSVALARITVTSALRVILGLDQTDMKVLQRIRGAPCEKNVRHCKW